MGGFSNGRYFRREAGKEKEYIHHTIIVLLSQRTLHRFFFRCPQSIGVSAGMCVSIWANERNTPDYLLGEAAVDGVDVLLQGGAGLCLDLLQFLQPAAGHKQTASLTVMRQHLLMGGKSEWIIKGVKMWTICIVQSPDWCCDARWRHAHLAELADDMSEDVAWNIIE